MCTILYMKPVPTDLVVARFKAWGPVDIPEFFHESVCRLYTARHSSLHVISPLIGFQSFQNLDQKMKVKLPKPIFIFLVANLQMFSS